MLIATTTIRITTIIPTEMVIVDSSHCSADGHAGNEHFESGRGEEHRGETAENSEEPKKRHAGPSIVVNAPTHATRVWSNASIRRVHPRSSDSGGAAAQ